MSDAQAMRRLLRQRRRRRASQRRQTTRVLIAAQFSVSLFDITQRSLLISEENASS